MQAKQNYLIMSLGSKAEVPALNKLAVIHDASIDGLVRPKPNKTAKRFR